MIKYIFILIFSPISFLFLLLISMLVIFFDGLPIFYLDKRLGKNNKPFIVYKFRTMKSIQKSKSNSDDRLRITKFGKILRRFSIDEIPQVLNIIKGEMNLIGPRPLPTEYLAYFSEKQKKRTNIKPGLTGWSQINGRNNLTWDNKIELDLWYIENKNFFLDIKIIIKTFILVFSGSGVSKKGYATTNKFYEEKKKK